MFPAFLRERSDIFEGNSLKPEVRTRLRSEYPFLDEVHYRRLEAEQSHKMFFDVGTVLAFINHALRENEHERMNDSGMITATRPPPTSAGDGLRLVGVRKTYSSGEVTVDALKGVDLSIRPGEMVAVWGPSGSGKSTLMNIIGLVDTPTAGRVDMPGRPDIYAQDDAQITRYRSQHIGFIFQSFNLIPVLSATENVMLPMQIQGVKAAEAEVRARALLEEVGLAPFANAWPDKLSGGQRQRVAIARALAPHPAIVIADEPTANLDTENSLAILDLMVAMNRKNGVTFIFTTHDQRLLGKIRRKILLRDGLLENDEVIG